LTPRTRARALVRDGHAHRREGWRRGGDAVIISTLAGSGQSDHEVRRFRPSLLRSHVEGVEGRHLFNLNR